MDVIAKAIEGLRIAMIAADSAALESLTADELSYGHTSGVIENKKEFIDAIVGNNKRDVFTRIDLSEHIISIVGDTAVARHHFSADVLVNGVLMCPDIQVLQVWIQKQGAWKLLVRQAYKI